MWNYNLYGFTIVEMTECLRRRPHCVFSSVLRNVQKRLFSRLKKYPKRQKRKWWKPESESSSDIFHHFWAFFHLLGWTFRQSTILAKSDSLIEDNSPSYNRYDIEQLWDWFEKNEINEKEDGNGPLTNWSAFESSRNLQFVVCKIVLKRMKINEKRPGMAYLKNTIWQEERVVFGKMSEGFWIRLTKTSVIITHKWYLTHIQRNDTRRLLHFTIPFSNAEISFNWRNYPLTYPHLRRLLFLRTCVWISSF